MEMITLSTEPLDPQRAAGEPGQERTLRPASLAEFIGQESLKANLKILIQAALKRGDALEHILFYGPPGLGKTTLAHLLTNETGGELIATSGPALERAIQDAGDELEKDEDSQIGGPDVRDARKDDREPAGGDVDETQEQELGDGDVRDDASDGSGDDLNHHLRG